MYRGNKLHYSQTLWSAPQEKKIKVNVKIKLRLCIQYCPYKKSFYYEQFLFLCIF